MTRRWEIPPTAGLPLRWRDLLNLSGDLAPALARQFSLPLPALTCSGTAALIIALRVLQQRMPGRTRLIVPAYTCPLVALAAHYCPPLRVVPCDLQPDSIDLDERQLAQLCDESTLAVVVTHLAGRVADVDAAKRIAGAVGAAIIEDAAQAMGALDDGRSVGLKGDVGFFSMALGKGLTTAEGGVLFSRDPVLHQALHRHCRQDLPFSLRWELQRSAELWGYALLYQPRGLHYVYGNALRKALANGDEVAAVGDDFSVYDIPLHRLGGYRQKVGAAALARLPDHLQQGRVRALRRAARLNALPGVTVIMDRPGQQGTWPFLMVVMPSADTRDAAMARLWTSGLGVTRLFIHTLPGYAEVLPLLQPGGDITRAQAFAARTLSISNSHWLSDALFEQIVDQLKVIVARPD
ncbi:nucleotide sugar aminotransferase [Pseudomonas aylmerensis]|uniref:Nucleotide sugar aminotransferase n=1 Tax=Pseudomonas aylmerensis TaxID=1869229 RepID=A0A2T4FTG2_9PSED|nr:DegT/DnrJ/EryC1/StrS family aminotransferase [Pseudomonas aylmerensis]OCW28550.1 nucleotide sugar aminotransferase [Pseudomonas aylmerensis]PTC26716.1 nucleotide sugar aminotransferase [Pseudomonas aylmerensis]